MKIDKKTSVTLYTFTQLILSSGILFYLDLLDMSINYYLIIIACLSVIAYTATAFSNVHFVVR